MSLEKMKTETPETGAKQSGESKPFDPDARIRPNETKQESAENKAFDPDQKLDPSKQFDDGDMRYDDNHKAYRSGNELLPNNTYEIHGYTYETDEKGRIISAEGKLTLKPEGQDKKTIKDSKETIGHGDQLETDDRGHLIADQFNGSNGMENIVAQDAKINQGDYKKLENQLADCVKQGDDVRVKVEPQYTGDSYRPDSIAYTYSINGETNVRIFPNEKE